MAKENTEVIYVQLDTSQVAHGVSRMTVALEELEAIVCSLGEGITTAFNGLLQIPATIASIDELGDLIGDIYEDYSQYSKTDEGFSIFKSILPETADTFSDIEEAFSTGWKKITTSISEAYNLFENSVSFTGNDVVKGVKDSVGAVSEYVAAVKTAAPEVGLFSAMFPQLSSAIQTPIGAITDYVAAVKTAAPEVGTFAAMFPQLSSGFASIGPAISSGFQNLPTTIGNIFGSIGKAFGGMNIGLTLAIVAIVAAIVLLIQNFDKIKAALLPIWEEHLKPLWDQMSLFLASVGENLRIIWESLLKPVIDWILSIFEPAVMAVIEVVMGALGGIVGFLSGIISAVMSILDGIIQFIAGVFSGDWQRAWDGIVKIFQGIFEGIVAIAKGVVNTIITVLNSLIGAIYSAVAGIVNGLGGIGEAVGHIFGQKWNLKIPSNPPQIPYLAQGAVLPANRPFLAVVGDQRHGTNVEAPLSTIQAAVAEVMARQGTGDINITFTGDLAQLGRVLKPVIERENRRVGGSLAKGVY